MRHAHRRKRSYPSAEYRGSPLGGIDDAFWHAQKHLDANGVKFLPGVNEELAATAV